MTNANERTPNLSFNLIPFDKRGYQNREYENWRALDALLTRFFAIANYKGVWNNSTAYEVGDRVVDAVNASVYEATVAHTSATIPTTFGEERTTFPGRWSLFTRDIAFRGEWESSTEYAAGDFVFSGRTFAVAVTSHTSSGVFADDVTNGFWQELLDGDQLLADTIDARALAQQWASEDEDVVVDSGEFSAKHYSIKASDSATSAAASAATIPDPTTTNNYIRGDGASAYELRTPAQVGSDLDLVKQTSPTDTTPGALLVNGAFGLGVDTSPAADDANDITWTSWYRTGSSTANLPSEASTSFGVLRTEARTNTYTIQTYKPTPAIPSYDTWMRLRTDSVWDDWRLVVGDTLLQRMRIAFSDTSTTSSTSFQDTHAVATITPKSDNSIIIVKYSGGFRTQRDDGGTARCEYRGLLSWSPSDGSGSNSSVDTKFTEIFAQGVNSCSVRGSLSISGSRQSPGAGVEMRFMVQHRVMLTAGESRVEGTTQDMVIEEWLSPGGL